MTFSESIRSSLIDNYANFEGTASRSEYWWFILFGLLVLFLAMVPLGVLRVTATSGFAAEAAGLIVLLLGLTFITPGLAVWVRRCHDIGRSTKVAVLIFVFNIYASSMAGNAYWGGISSSVVFTLIAAYWFYLAIKKGGA